MITFLFSAFIFNSNAQVWIDSGAVWHYEYSGVSSFGYKKFEHVSDWILNGQSCKRIDCTSYNFTYGQNSELVYLGNEVCLTNYTYVSGDTVFYLNVDTFRVLLDFSAQIGDSWIISIDSMGDPQFDDTSRVVVTGTGFETINGQHFRYIEIEPVGCGLYHFTGRFVERFGLYGDAVSDIFPVIYDCDSTVFNDYNVNTFRCFEDASITVTAQNAQDCEYPFNILGNTDYQVFDFSVFPNPATNQFMLQGLGTETVSLLATDLSGKIVLNLEGVEQGRLIDVSHLKSGMYLLKVSQDGRSSTRKIIIE